MRKKVFLILIITLVFITIFIPINLVWAASENETIKEQQGEFKIQDFLKNSKEYTGEFFEDIDIMHEVFYKANTIVYTNAKLYAYQHRENSITTQAFSQKDLYIQNICEKIRKFAKENDKKLVNASIAYSVVGMMRVFINTPREPQFIENINASRLYIQNNGMRILKDRNVRKKTKIAIILFFVSKKLLFFVHSKINRWR